MERLHALAFWEVAWFFCGEVAWFFVWTNWQINNRWDARQAAFCDSRNVIVESLHGFFLGGQVECFFGWEVAWFCMWRGCMIFVCREVAWHFSLAHSIRLHDLFFWRLRDFFVEWLCDFFGEVAWFLVERLRDFFVWRGCVIFCVKSLRDFCVKGFLVKIVSGEGSFFSGENSFWWNFFGHYCHYCTYSNYCHIGS